MADICSERRKFRIRSALENGVVQVAIERSSDLRGVSLKSSGREALIEHEIRAQADISQAPERLVTGAFIMRANR